MKIYNIQALRGIAVLMVLFYHLLSLENKYGVMDKIWPQVFHIGMHGVDLFFIISGFIMVWVTQQSFQNMKKIKRFIYHRITRIYPIYWFFTIIILILFLIKPSMVNSAHSNQADILESFLLLPYEHALLVNVGWTLIYEMYFYFIFTFLLFFNKKILLYIMPLFIMITIFANIIQPNYLNENIYLKYIYNPFILEFFIGSIAALMFIYKNNKIYIYFIISFLLSLFIASLIQYNLSDKLRTVWDVLVIGLPIAFMVYFVIDLEQKNRFVFPKILQDIGNASYSIYLSHILVLSVVGRVWISLPEVWRGSNYIMILIMIMSVLVAGYIFFLFIEKPILKYSRKIEKKYFNWS